MFATRNRSAAGTGLRRRRRALSDDECARLLAAAEEDDERLGHIAALDGRTRVPQAPLFRWLLALGCRYGETIALTWGAVDFEQAVVVLRAETTKSRTVDLHALRHTAVSRWARQGRAAGRRAEDAQASGRAAHGERVCARGGGGVAGGGGGRGAASGGGGGVGVCTRLSSGLF
jgi:integrase